MRQQSISIIFSRIKWNVVVYGSYGKRMQQAGEVVVPYITENPFMSEEQISKVKAGDTISFDHDVRLKMETVKDADEKEWIGVFTSSEEMYKGSAGNV